MITTASTTTPAVRRWRVRRLSYTDLWNDEVDLLYLDNGYWGYALDVSPICCWPSRYGSVIVKGVPTLAIGHDYLYNANNQCQHFIFPAAYGDRFGSAYSAFTAGIGFVANPGQTAGQDSWTYISPESIDPSLEYFGFFVDRICTALPKSGTVGPVVDMELDKTPMVYIAWDQNGTPIWRNDNDPQTPGETYRLEGIPGNNDRSFLVKPVYVPHTGGSSTADVYIAVRVTEVGRSGTYIRATPLGPYLKGTVYTKMFPLQAICSAQVTGAGWVYIPIDHNKLRHGWNYLLIDINHPNNQSDDYIDIGIDTSVTTTLANRAWFWYNAARGFGVLRTVYTFWRDIDKIRWHARNVNVFGYWNGTFGLTYNTQIVGGPYGFRPARHAEQPFGSMFDAVPCHLDHAPTHVELYTIDSNNGRVKQNVMINTGTSGEWDDFLYRYTAGIGLELNIQHVDEPSESLKQADLWYGIRIYGRTEGGITKPGWSFTIKPVRVTSQDIVPTDLAISNIDDAPWGRTFTGYDPNEHRSNDFVMYFRTQVGGSTNLPACEVDISRMVRFYHSIL